jgi:hypothetical protein
MMRDASAAQNEMGPREPVGDTILYLAFCQAHYTSPCYPIGLVTTKRHGPNKYPTNPMRGIVLRSNGWPITKCCLFHNPNRLSDPTKRLRQIRLGFSQTDAPGGIGIFVPPAQKKHPVTLSQYHQGLPCTGSPSM